MFILNSNAWKDYIQECIHNGYIRNNYCQQADRLLENIFLFDNEYAMEPTNVGVKLNPINWNISPNGDPEWLFMLKRQEYLLDLLLAYYGTKNVKYQEKMKELILDWINNNLANDATWRTIDTGIRLLNWTSPIANLLAEEKIGTEELDIINEAVKIQAKYLYDNYTEKFDISNWGVLITTGILVYDAYFAGVIDTHIVEWAEKKLGIELDLQINDVGMHWEQSPLYQLEVWRSTLAVIAARKYQKKYIPDLWINKMKKVQYSIVHYLKPNGELLGQGDTDNIRIDSICNVSSCILALPKLPIVDKKFDFQILELLHEEVELLSEEKLECEFFDYDSGNFFGRNDWNGSSSYWHAYNGSLGSGHGHAALGHIDLCIDGQDVLVDSGRFTYVDGVVRRYLKSSEAHNTITIDNKPFSLPKDSWKYKYVAIPLGNQFSNKKLSKVLKMQYLDNEREVPAIVTRFFIILPEDVYVLIDLIMQDGKHSFKINYQLSPKFDNVYMSDNVYNIEDKYALSSTIVNSQKSLGYYSSKYNKLDKNVKLEYFGNFTNVSVEGTVIGRRNMIKSIEKIIPFQSGSDEVILPEKAIGFKVALFNNEDYLITIEPTNTIVGRKLYWYDGTPAYGPLNIFRRRDNNIVEHMKGM